MDGKTELRHHSDPEFFGRELHDVHAVVARHFRDRVARSGLGFERSILILCLTLPLMIVTLVLSTVLSKLESYYQEHSGDVVTQHRYVQIQFPWEIICWIPLLLWDNTTSKFEDLSLSRMSYLPRFSPTIKTLLAKFRPKLFEDTPGMVLLASGGRARSSLNYYTKKLFHSRKYDPFRVRYFSIKHPSRLNPSQHNPKFILQRSLLDIPLASPFVLKIIVEYVSAVVVLSCSIISSDFVSCAAAALISVVTSLVGIAHKGTLMWTAASIHNEGSSNSDVIIKHPNGGFDVVHSDGDAAVSLLFGDTIFSYGTTVKTSNWISFVARWISFCTILLLSCATTEMRILWTFAYIFIFTANGLIKILLEDRIRSMQYYEIHEHRIETEISNRTYTDAVWAAIALSQSTAWVKEGGIIPDDTKWNEWLQHAQANIKPLSPIDSVIEPGLKGTQPHESSETRVVKLPSWDAKAALNQIFRQYDERKEHDGSKNQNSLSSADFSRIPIDEGGAHPSLSATYGSRKTFDVNLNITRKTFPFLGVSAGSSLEKNQRNTRGTHSEEHDIKLEMITIALSTDYPDSSLLASDYYFRPHLLRRLATSDVLGLGSRNIRYQETLVMPRFLPTHGSLLIRLIACVTLPDDGTDYLDKELRLHRQFVEWAFNDCEILAFIRWYSEATYLEQDNARYRFCDINFMDCVRKCINFSSYDEGVEDALDIFEQSADYKNFKLSVETSNHELYYGRLNKTLGLLNVIGEQGRVLDAKGLAATVLELAWTPTNRICNQSIVIRGYQDKIKAHIENIMGQTLLWHPLRPPTRPLRPGYDRVSWTSPDRTTKHHFDVPRGSFSSILRTMTSAPYIFIPPLIALPSHVTKTSIASPSPENAASTASSQVGRSSMSIQPGPQQPFKVTNSKQFFGPNASTIQTKQSTGTDAKLKATRHLYLCVQNGSSYQYTEIETCALASDAEFFRVLKRNYIRLRGRVKHWLCIWQYDRCDFYRFQKHPFDGLNDASPEKIGYPEFIDTSYDFNPRPINPEPPHGPITDSEFRNRFWLSCDSCHSWHLWHQAQRKRLLHSQSAIELLPKRTSKIIMDDGQRESFWGIYARERLSAVHLLLYALLANASCLVFPFLWLFVWDHPGDLQNAVVPLSITLPLSIFAIALWDARREKPRP